MFDLVYINSVIVFTWHKKLQILARIESLKRYTIVMARRPKGNCFHYIE